MDAPPADTIGQTQADQLRPIDALTVACIAVFSYQLAVPIIHDGLGHGLTAAVLGASGIRLTSSALFYDVHSVSQEGIRIINIAGPVASLLGGLLFAIYDRNIRSRNAEFRYFVWLTAYVCLFQGGGYLMALFFVNFGDINEFVKGLDSPFAWRLGFTIVGVLGSLVGLSAAGRALDDFLGRSRRRARAAKLVVVSYFAGSVPLILSGFLNPRAGLLPIVSGVPSTFGGTLFLLTICAIGSGPSQTIDEPFPPLAGEESSLVLCGGARHSLYVLVLGPGVPR